MTAVQLAPHEELRSLYRDHHGWLQGWLRGRLGHAADAEGIADGVIAILNLPTLTGQMLALDGGEHIEWPPRRGPTPRRK